MQAVKKSLYFTSKKDGQKQSKTGYIDRKIRAKVRHVADFCSLCIDFLKKTMKIDLIDYPYLLKKER